MGGNSGGGRDGGDAEKDFGGTGSAVPPPLIMPLTFETASWPTI